MMNSSTSPPSTEAIASHSATRSVAAASGAMCENDTHEHINVPKACEPITHANPDRPAGSRRVNPTEWSVPGGRSRRQSSETGGRGHRNGDNFFIREPKL